MGETRRRVGEPLVPEAEKRRLRKTFTVEARTAPDGRQVYDARCLLCEHSAGGFLLRRGALERAYWHAKKAHSEA